MAYNVTAVSQSDSYGYGPAYLLNGLSDQGYWYQIGLSYDWPYLNGGYVSGFAVNYEVFSSDGSSIFPAGGGGGLATLSGPVNNGDEVLLNLYFSAGQVEMYVYDWNTGATASVSYQAFGSSFVGLSTSADSNGFFTGLMTEWYHVNAYYGTEEAVKYSNPNFALSSGIFWADEYIAPCCTSVIFGNAQDVTFQNPSLLQSFSTNGATAYANAYEFISGYLAEDQLTFSYSVVGGGSGYSPPVLTYIYEGQQYTTNLSEFPNTYNVDSGTSWSVSQQIPGSSSSARWSTNQATSGLANSPLTLNFVYYLQFPLTASWSVVDGGSPIGPSLTGTQYGLPISLSLGFLQQTVWLDSGSSWNVRSTLGGSNSERWQLNQETSGIVSSSSTVDFAYYHQYLFTLSYSVAGGGNPSSPIFNAEQFGTSFTTTLTGTPRSVFLDAGSNWTVPNLLPGSSSGERWNASQTNSGTVTGSSTIAFDYQHQYFLNTSFGPSPGGSVAKSTGWYSAGTSVQISAVANSGWKFEGWNGSGSSSYTGQSGQTTVQMNGPVIENATFYPGLTITSSEDGGVSYSYGTQSGSVKSGTTATIYAPAGSTITLTANPSLFIYRFDAWTPNTLGTSNRVVLNLDSPLTANAAFTLNIIVVGGIIALLAAAAVVSAIILRIRPKSPSAGALPVS